MKIFRILICLLLFVAARPTLSAQQVNMDSLKKVVAAGVEDTNTVIAYRALCGILGNIDPREGIYYGWKGVALGKKIRWDKGVAGCYLNLGAAFNNLGSFDTAIAIYDTALIYSKRVGEPKRTALIYINIAAVHIYTGKLEKAMQAALAAKPFAEASADPDRIARVDMTLGNIYYYQNRWQDAYPYYKKCLPVFEQLGNTGMVATSYMNLGIVLKNIGKVDSARILTEKAQEMFTAIGDNEKLLIAYSNLGAILQLQDDLPGAERAFNAAVELAMAIGDTEQEVFNKHSQAEILFLRKQFDRSEALLLEIREVAIKNNYYEELSYIAETLSLLYSAKGNFDKAYVYLQEYNIARDTLDARRSNEVLMQLQEAYEAEQREQQIALLAANTELQDQEIRQKQLTIVILLVGFLSMTVLGVVLINRYRLKQQLKEVQLRNKIASDLHDDVGATLSSIKMYSEIIRRDIPDSQNQAHMFLAKISDNARESIENMSDIVWMVKPGNDKFTNLAMRMQEYAQSVCLSRGMTLHSDLQPGTTDHALPMNVRRDLYLVFKEAVNNAAKYSASSDLFVTLAGSKDQIKLVVADTGKGFDAASAQGNGLGNMRNRTRALGGSCAITSAPDKGTTVEVLIPIT